MTDPATAPHPGRVLAALADKDRLRVLAAVVLAGPADEATLAAGAGMAEADTRRALGRLADAGVVAATPDGRWESTMDGLVAAARLASRLQVAADPGEGASSPQQAAVLRAYFHNGRLRSIPAQRQKRRAVLDWLSQQFEPGRVYIEADVNRILERFHPDPAALRRFLIDEEFMDRRQGFYWRAGGTFVVE